MLTNASCTIYHRSSNPSDGHDQWERIYVHECWRFVQNKASITESGMKSASVLTVRIFDLDVEVKKGDYIVVGECPVEMTTIKDLKSYEHFKVTLANYNDFGDSPHIKVVAE